MNFERYEVGVDDNFDVYEFISEGPKGKISKLVKYTETNLKGLYNLGFGDKDEITGDINDLVVTNNGDSQKVLATVASTVYQFIERYPNAVIVATGSTKARTRLYQIGISNNIESILIDFNVFGLLKGIGWVTFDKEQNYEAVFIRKKKG